MAGLNYMIDRFCQQAPVAAMVRAAMANVLSSDALDIIFEQSAQRQYRDELLFSSVVKMLALVVTKASKSLHAAYQSNREQLSVSVRSLYSKIAGVEERVCRALVRRTAAQMEQVCRELEPSRPSMLGDYEVRVLDGSHLAATEHRIRETRSVQGGPLPGQALVVLDPRYRLVVDIIPCQDGHTQERLLLGELVDQLRPGQVWIADRNFCTKLLISAARIEKSCVIVRHHAGLPVTEMTPWKPAGRAEGGQVHEQSVSIDDGDEVVQWRRVRLMLDQRTKDGTRVIEVLTNLPPKVTASEVADAYHGRWSIEAVFGELTLALRGEIDTLGYPPAALLAYSIALVMYNLLSVVQSALRSVHDEEAERTNISVYYLADEVSRVWEGMDIAIDRKSWDRQFGSLSPPQLARSLKAIARHAELRRYRKHSRGPKKPRPKRTGPRTQVSTARHIRQRR
jgi:hypothetical protein